MTMTEQRLKTLALCPQDYRLREPLDVLGEPGLVKLAGADTGIAVGKIARPTTMLFTPRLSKGAVRRWLWPSLSLPWEAPSMRAWQGLDGAITKR